MVGSRPERQGHGTAIIVMGVSGAGKTTVGSALAEALEWEFHDADDFHSAANIAKMTAGLPLTDEDRRPWLAALNEMLRARTAAGQSVVLACSALKQSYRDRLQQGISDPRFVYLDADRATLLERLRDREDHFMPEDLLGSQLATLEEPLDALKVDAGEAVDVIVGRVLDSLVECPDAGKD